MQDFPQEESTVVADLREERAAQMVTRSSEPGYSVTEMKVFGMDGLYKAVVIRWPALSAE